MYVLTLVSPRQQTDFDIHIRHALNNITINDRDVLENGIAVDWILANPLPKTELDMISTVYQVDVFQQQLCDRPKKLFMADMDSTIVNAETLDEMAAKTGLGEKIAAITERAMRGELDFEQALTERVAMLKGLSETVIAETLNEMTLNNGAEILLRGLKRQGIYCVLISGGFTQFTSVVAQNLGFDAHFGNELVIEDSRLTGDVKRPILDKAFKKSKLEELKQSMNLQSKDICAIGDGANDLPMLQAAGFGIGYYPKPLVVDSLDNIVRYTDLSSLCYALKL